MLAAATSSFARLGDTQEEFEQANPDFKYMGESRPDGNTRVRQYAREGTVAQIIFGADGKVVTEAYSELSGKAPESSLVPVAKSYGYDFSALEKSVYPSLGRSLFCIATFGLAATISFASVSEM